MGKQQMERTFSFKPTWTPARTGGDSEVAPASCNTQVKASSSDRKVHPSTKTKKILHYKIQGSSATSLPKHSFMYIYMRFTLRNWLM